MALEFKAEKIGDSFVIKAIPERKENGSLVIHVPSIPLIKKLTNEAKKDELIKEIQKIK